MDAGKPIIGITGGIGAGKSFIAKLFGRYGCLVIHADELVRGVYDDPAIGRTLAEWWGRAVFDADGNISRSAIAGKIFGDPVERARLERLIHPLVAAARDRRMAESANDSQVLAYVWDTPLLFETGQHRDCDHLVFVDAPRAMRLKRVSAGRGWTEGELDLREKSQMPLDKKREMSDHVLSNTADVEFAERQVRRLLSRIVNRSIPKPPPA